MDEISNPEWARMLAELGLSSDELMAEIEDTRRDAFPTRREAAEAAEPAMVKNLMLILGGARSGKSVYAERLAAASGQAVLYVATAQAIDAEMQERIRRHQASRPAHWRTLEAPRAAGEAIRRAAADGEWVLVDCLTVLVANVVLAGGDDVTLDEARPAVEAEVDGLLRAAREHAGRVCVVSNEVGMGVVPPYPLGRVYRDLLGWANQRVAAAAGEVCLMVAGLPLKVK
jgi:adenosylcobinamide kinase / adenosylcobinamide-phosphate guanylyltransferase